MEAMSAVIPIFPDFVISPMARKNNNAFTGFKLSA